MNVFIYTVFGSALIGVSIIFDMFGPKLVSAANSDLNDVIRTKSQCVSHKSAELVPGIVEM